MSVDEAIAAARFLRGGDLPSDAVEALRESGVPLREAVDGSGSPPPGRTCPTCDGVGVDNGRTCADCHGSGTVPAARQNRSSVSNTIHPPGKTSSPTTLSDPTREAATPMREAMLQALVDAGVPVRGPAPPRTVESEQDAIDPMDALRECGVPMRAA